MKAAFWLIADSLCGRAGPQLAPWSVAELRAGGIHAVINLSEHPSDIAAFQAVGIDACWVPLPTDCPPTDASRDQCIEALPRAIAFVSTQIAQRRRVLVHCHAGQDRTGMLLAAILARRDGCSAREAIDKVRTVRPLAITAPGWESLALEVIPRALSTLP